MPRRGAWDWTYVPSGNDDDRIDKFNNPNRDTFPSASADPNDWRNIVGYVTYVQFMLDWGRDRSPTQSNSNNANPASGGKTPLSLLSPDCPIHLEVTAGGTFSFPPRTQPMHAVRRAMIAAINTVKSRNGSLPAGYGDQVAVITYDGLDAYHTPQLLVPLTADYDAAMQACATMQEVADIGKSTATESGLIAARNVLRSPAAGGSGRSFAKQVIVLLTDGVPNLWSSSNSTIADAIDASESPGDYYSAGYTWYNAPLMQAELAHLDQLELYPIGMGLGADYDFMDRMARLAATAEGGVSVRGSGNPAEYEQRLIEIFEDIVNNPGGRLVR
jgi:hypothetical protein